MVSLKNWKLDPKTQFFEVADLCSRNPLTDLMGVIKQKGSKFVDEHAAWVTQGVIQTTDFQMEREARKQLLKALLQYAKISNTWLRKTQQFKPSLHALSCETVRKMNEELASLISQVFSFQIGKFTLTKRKGESIYHFLCRYLIADYLGRTIGIRELYEEYSKMKEALRSIMVGEEPKEAWKKIAKRSDLYLVLKDGQKIWLEAELGHNSEEIRKKLRRLRKLMKVFPSLIDKIIIVSPVSLPMMTLGYLQEARELGILQKIFEFYQIDIVNGKVLRAQDARVIKTEFGNAFIDMVADGVIKGGHYMPELEKIRSEIIRPLANGTINPRVVQNKARKYRNIVTFWRKGITVMKFPPKAIQEKHRLVVMIKKNYPFLFERIVKT